MLLVQGKKTTTNTPFDLHWCTLGLYEVNCCVLHLTRQQRCPVVQVCQYYLLECVTLPPAFRAPLHLESLSVFLVYCWLWNLNLSPFSTFTSSIEINEIKQQSLHLNWNRKCFLYYKCILKNVHCLSFVWGYFSGVWMSCSLVFFFIQCTGSKIIFIYIIDKNHVFYIIILWESLPLCYPIQCLIWNQKELI